jgi:hypothetical protein
LVILVLLATLKGEQMTLRSRLVLGLLTMLVCFSMASTSFAQVSISVITDPSAQEIQTSRNAQTASPGVVGDGILVSGAIVAPSPLTTTVLRLTFPSTITSSPVNCVPFTGSSVAAACPTIGAVVTSAIPTGDPIRIEGATGVFQNVSLPRLNTTNKRIEIVLPGTATGETNSSSGSFRLVGVRIDANGLSGAQSVTASLDSGANNYLLTTTTATVINALGAGIGNFAIGARSGVTSTGTATIFTNRTVPDTTGSLILAEGFASAFRTNSQNSNSAVGLTNGNSTQIRLTFNGIPAGVTLTLSANAPSTMTALFSGSVNATVTAASNTAVISFTATSLSTTETLEIDYSVSVNSTAAVTTLGTITATATLFPIGDGVVNDNSTLLGLPRQDQGYPTFAQADLGPITVVNIAAANTTLLIPLAEKVSTFDTGISVANTTADPFNGSAGGGAVASAGTLRFDFFPSTATGAGTACTLTTSATNRPGAGIASDGTIPAGATYLVLLSQLLPLSNCAAGDFFGYIFIQANFLNAHGAATISDFRTYSLASPVLVMAPPATSPRSSPSGSVESLNN